MIRNKLEWIAILSAALLPGAGRTAQPETISEILDGTGVTGGLIVQIGCEDGQSAVDLRANEGCFLYGSHSDRAKVASARRRVLEAGLSESVWVDQLDGEMLPFADNIVNLLISENLGAVKMEEVIRVLVPDGVACIKQGGKLIIFSTTDGRKLAAYDLSSAPVFDGMAAANGRIYLSAQGGKLTCFAGKP